VGGEEQGLFDKVSSVGLNHLQHSVERTCFEYVSKSSPACCHPCFVTLTTWKCSSVQNEQTTMGLCAVQVSYIYANSTVVSESLDAGVAKPREPAFYHATV